MSNYVLNLIINILLMSFAIFTVLDLIRNESHSRSFLIKINKKGWVLIIMATLSIGFNLIRDWQADSKQAETENERASSDSLLKASQQEILKLQLLAKEQIIEKVDSTYLKSIKASNEALAKYNLQITDSLHSVVSTLKLKSLNTQLLIHPLEKENKPVFLSEKNGEHYLNIQFISKGGTSFNIRLRRYILKQMSIEKFVILDSAILSFESFLAEDVTRTSIVSIPPDLLNDSSLIVYVTGSFSKDPQGEITIPYNEAFSFNFNEDYYISGILFDYTRLKRQLNMFP